MNPTAKTLLTTILTISILGPLNAFGMDHKVISLTNEEDTDQTEFLLQTDDQNEEIQGLKINVFSRGGKLVETRKYQVKNLNRGVTIKRTSGRDVVIIRSNNFALHNGGNLTIDTLYSGISGARKKYNFELARAGSDWELLKNNRAIRNIHLISNKKFIVGTIGIKDMRLSYR